MKTCEAIFIPTKSRWLNDELGSSTIEFVVSIFISLLLIFGIIEYCSLIHAQTVLADAANEGVRYMLVNHSDQSGASTKVQQYAALTLHDTKNIDVEFSYPDGDATPPNRVGITVTYSYLPYLSWVIPDPPTLTAYAEGRTMN